MKTLPTLNITGSKPMTPWNNWRKISFRFFFIYILLQITPWTWIDLIPGMRMITQFYYQFIDWLVYAANDHVFHVRTQLVPLNGSGDTSYAWTQLWLYLSLAAIGCCLWSVADRKSTHYIKSDYWLRTFTRYFIAMQALSYGIIKLYAMQMSFPNLSQLATPLGDFLPMRFSWLFIGYSEPYQVFSGVMEVIAGLLLLNRKTVTMGLCAAVAVFANVVMLNLSYDIPVKLFSLHLLFYSLFLLAYDAQRLIQFFVLNQPVSPSYSYQITFSDKRTRYGRLALKSVLIFFIAVFPLYDYYQYYQSSLHQQELKPIAAGLYDVIAFSINGDTVPVLANDTLIWKDVIFEKGGLGSVNSTDTLFRQRYRRGYFYYQPDSTTNTMSFIKRSVTGDSTFLFNSRYELPDNNTIRLWAKIRNDSVYVELLKSKRHFQLAEKQFHWLSEYNR
jgi:hypothetical protein